MKGVGLSNLLYFAIYSMKTKQQVNKLSPRSRINKIYQGIKQTFIWKREAAIDAEML